MADNYSHQEALDANDGETSDSKLVEGGKGHDGFPDCLDSGIASADTRQEPLSEQQVTSDVANESEIDERKRLGDNSGNTIVQHVTTAKREFKLNINFQFKQTVTDFFKNFKDERICSGILTDERTYRAITHVFQIVRRLGNTVFQCYSSATNLFFVIKLVEEEMFLKRKQEVEIPMAFTEFNWMIKLYGLGKIEYSQKPHAVVFMEYAGESLKKMTGWPYIDLCLFLYQLLQALQELHVHEVAHCDIKLENICILNNRVVLIDWETAKYPMLPPQAFKGTRQYLPPWFQEHFPVETKTGYKDECKSLDLWAAGIVFYQLYTGKQIFKPIPDLPSPLKEVVNGLLPRSGKIKDQISLDEALDLLENSGHPITMQLGLKTFQIPVNMKFKEILKIPEIAVEVAEIKSKINASGWSTWIKEKEKWMFLHGSKITKTNFEIDITPVCN